MEVSSSKEQPGPKGAGRGTVYLVGAGPGDPGLITVRGLELLKTADVVVYDSLVNPVFLEHVRDDAKRVFVGKRAKNPLVEQAEINEFLVQQASQGLDVVRLKGGDPFLFARGGEEAEALHAAGIAFEVVPGVCSPLAAAAYAGIPLTHRKFTSTLVIVTGHQSRDKPLFPAHIEKLAGCAGTIAVLMCMGNLEAVVDEILRGGRSESTPAVVIQWGTLPWQRSVTGKLGEIAKKARSAGLDPPAILVVGEVVRFRNTLNWFESKPLFGRSVAVTRPREQSQEIMKALHAQGAEVMAFPTIEILPPEDWAGMDHAIGHIEEIDWIVFTSVNGVDAFFERLALHGRDGRHLAHTRLAAIGPATADRIASYHLNPDMVPGDYTTSGLLSAFGALKENAGTKVLLPRSDIAPRELPDGLRSMGYHTVDVVAYRTVPGRPAEDAVERVKQGKVDFVAFTSASTVDNFVEIVGKGVASELPASVRFVSIGPGATKACKKHGLKVAMEASEHTTKGLVHAILSLAKEDSRNDARGQ